MGRIGGREGGVADDEDECVYGRQVPNNWGMNMFQCSRVGRSR